MANHSKLEQFKYFAVQ